MRKAEERFLVGSGEFAGALKHLGAADREQLTVEAISAEAVMTSEVEGAILDRAGVQLSIRRQLGLVGDKHAAKPAEEGIAELMVDLFRTFAEPISAEMLLGWHRMMMKGRTDLTAIGAYRTGEEPMQIVSGAFAAPKVHFEAPPSAFVPDEMERFIDWFNQSAPGGKCPLPALTRGHRAYLFRIHPPF